MKHWQQAVKAWLIKALGDAQFNSTLERSSRFFEEATELAQATGLPRELAQTIFDSVYDRPSGEVRQEVGGTFITMLALAENQKVYALNCLQDEFNRINTPEIIEKVRQRAKEKKERGIGI